MPRIASLRLLFAVTILIAFFPYSGCTQTNWLLPRTENGVAIEVSKVNWEYGPKYVDEWMWLAPEKAFDAFATLSFLHGWFHVWDKLSFRVEVPMASMDWDLDYLAGGSHSRAEDLSSIFEEGLRINNPYVGVEYSGNESGIIARGGYRFSQTKTGLLDATALGMIGAMNRPEAFFPFSSAISIAGGYRRISVNDPVVLTVVAGPTWVTPDYAPADCFVDYSLILGLEFRSVDFRAALQGRYWVTEKGLTFDERNDSWMALGLDLKLWRVRPGIHVDYPLDYDYWSYLDLVYGIDLAYVW